MNSIQQAHLTEAESAERTADDLLRQSRFTFNGSAAALADAAADLLKIARKQRLAAGLG